MAPTRNSVEPIDWSPYQRSDGETIFSIHGHKIGLSSTTQDSERCIARSNQQECLQKLRHFFAGNLRLNFKDETLEKFYQVYVSKQKAVHFISIFVFNVCFAIVLTFLSAFTFSTTKIPVLVVIPISFLISLVSFIAYKRKTVAGTTLIALSYLIWLLILVQIFVKLVTQDLLHTATDCTAWIVLLCYFGYVVLPLQRMWCLILSLSVSAVHMIIVLIHAFLHGPLMVPHIIGERLGALALCYLTVNVLGFMTAFLSEKNHRLAFLEIKDSIIANAYIEEQLLEQEELLTSVLPKHLASNMMQDLVVGEEIEPKNKAFRRMYMNRHENVSILFADIVGFTTYSSLHDAAEVVELLNELFATFDDLAEKYHQLRIRILGDCYYCISGAPDPRPDHAVLCIHMGLAMIEAINLVREHKGSYVDMRVGIHTGKVMGGLVGQKQWQYDVMSKEVTIANKMESYGLPGKVQVSEALAALIRDEFVLEEREIPEDSELQKFNMKMFVVKAVLKPYPAGTLDEFDPNFDDAESLIDGVSSKRTTKSLDDDSNISSKLYREMIRKEDNNVTNLVKTNTFALMFKDKLLERSYRQKENQHVNINIVALDFVIVMNLFVHMIAYPLPFAVGAAYSDDEMFFVNSILLRFAIQMSAANRQNVFVRTILVVLPYVSGIALLLPLRLLSLGSHLQKLTRCTANSVYGWIDENRHVFTFLTAMVVYGAHLISYVFSGIESVEIAAGESCHELVNCTTDKANHIDEYHRVDFFMTELCLVMIATHLLNHIGYIARASFMVLLSLACVLAVFLSDSKLMASMKEFGHAGDYIHVNGLASVIGAALVLTCLSYQRDKNARKLFLSRIESDNQRERINRLRNLNNQLVHNILPPYIADMFLHRQKRELYSESYDDVGVMFVAIPNFQEFYSEEVFNNDGLECIRFLNEIISDFDELLDDSRFSNIRKIKTIASTYMVASGMYQHVKCPDTLITQNESNVVPGGITLEFHQPAAQDASTKHHLPQLVNFAYSLRNQMDNINSQSFNTFELQIGVFHGPVVGGVIGARKPHYDIWGNTVNVASRMESTGMPGKIQLTEDTKVVLEKYGDYKFELRGQIFVKGKGHLTTYFLSCPSNTKNSYLWAS